MKRLPLSLSQLDIWTEQQAWPNSPHLNIGGFSKLSGDVELTVLEQALKVLVKQNDSLRLVINESGQQMCLKDVEPEFKFVNFINEEQPEEMAKQWQKVQMTELFTNKSVPPIRFALLKTSAQCHYIILQSSHLIMDGWSVSDAIRKWAHIYSQLLQKQEVQEKSWRDYASFIEDSRKYKASRAFGKDQEYWGRELTKIPEKLFDRKYGVGVEAKIAKAHVATCRVKKTLMDSFQQLLKRHDCSLLHGFVAILSVYLYKMYNRSQLVIGLPTLNRSGGKYKNTLGMFVGVIPVNIKVTAEATVLDIAQQISKKLSQSYRHAKYPLSEHIKRLKLVEKNQDKVFDVMFSYESFSFDCHFGNARIVETRQTFSGLTRYPLAISLGEFLLLDDAEMVLEGKEEYFSSQDTKLVGLRLLSMLEEVLLQPSLPISELSIFAKEEVPLLNSSVQQTPSFSVEQSIFTNIFKQAQLNPDNPAIIWQQRSITYRQLLLSARNLAVILKRQGVKPGDVVAFSLEKGPEILIAIFAIVQLRAAFLPVDVNIPEQRLLTIANIAQCNIVIVNKDHSRLSALPLTIAAIDVDELLTEHAFNDEGNTHFELDDLAYVMFTSGTTGTPKGVKISHKALTLRLLWLMEHWHITAKDRSLQVTQSHFDPALIELLLPLTQSGTVVFPTATRSLPEQWPRLVEQYAITLIAFVPSTLKHFTSGVQSFDMRSLRVCCCGGEVLEHDVANLFIDATGADLFNVYGPTEATIFATAWKVMPQHKLWHALPVGAGLTQTQIFILDPQQQLLPAGAVGEIYLAGDTLSDGYLGEQTHTNEYFVFLPKLTKSKLYRTGDFGWLDGDDVLHFSERRDRQIKLRGYRIELSEIESALKTVPGVTAAAVKLQTSDSHPQIQAWLEIENKSASVPYQKYLSQRLPDYMLPSRYHIVAQMPYTTTGKVAYSSLVEQQALSQTVTSRPAIGTVEKALLAIWREVLNKPSLSVFDNFFEHGGDSLAAVHMLTKVEAHFSLRLPLHALVDNNDVASLALSIEQELSSPAVLLSLAQSSKNASLYIAASGNGDVIRFKALAKAMEGVCDLYMLQPPEPQFASDIEQLSELYYEKIARSNQGKIYIAGFSVGGLAALETANKLVQRGREVQELFIVDTILLKMPKLGIWLWQGLIGLNKKLPSLTKLVLSPRHRSVIADQGLFMQVNAMRTHQINKYNGNTSLLKSSIYYRVQNMLIGQWRTIITGKLKEYKIAASHSRFFDPGKVDKLAEILITKINDKK